MAENLTQVLECGGESEPNLWIYPSPRLFYLVYQWYQSCTSIKHKLENEISTYIFGDANSPRRSQVYFLKHQYKGIFYISRTTYQFLSSLLETKYDNLKPLASTILLSASVFTRTGVTSFDSQLCDETLKLCQYLSPYPELMSACAGFTQVFTYDSCVKLIQELWEVMKGASTEKWTVTLPFSIAKSIDEQLRGFIDDPIRFHKHVETSKQKHVFELQLNATIFLLLCQNNISGCADSLKKQKLQQYATLQYIKLSNLQSAIQLILRQSQVNQLGFTDVSISNIA